MKHAKYSLVPKGFTFIELLIGLVIMAIIFSIGFANYREFSSRQKIEGATREIKADLRLAQQKATIGSKPTWCDINGYDLTGYRVWRASSTSYSVRALCEGNEVPIKFVQLTDYYPNIFLSDFDVTFLPLGEGAYSPTDQYSLMIAEIVGGLVINDRRIDVTVGGEIN